MFDRYIHRIAILTKTLVFVAVLGCTLAGFASMADAASLFRYVKTSRITSSVDLNYARTWGSGGTSSGFNQKYAMGFGGIYLDYRLMTFNFNSDLNIKSASGVVANSSQSDDWDAGFDLAFSFFNRITRNRGMKMWKYVPSPITLDLGFREGLNNRTMNIGMGLHYSLPGYLRFFDSGKFMHYDLGLKKAVAKKKNRYRVKYSDESINNNRNGNGNWNRNGNGNWNRNGNGLNRNGGNKYGNWNRDQLKLSQRQPIGFHFPNISFDIYKYVTEFKATSSKTSIFNYNLRMSTQNSVKNWKGLGPYKSTYKFRYSYSEKNVTSGSSLERRVFGLNAQNNWSNLQLMNDYHSENESTLEYQHLLSQARYWNSINKYINYSLNANYANQNINGIDIYSLSLGGSMGAKIQKQKRLSPRLMARHMLSANVSVSQVDDGSGEPTTASGYGVNAAESLISTHFAWLDITGTGSVSFAKDQGLPLGLGISFNSKGFARTTFRGGLNSSMYIPKDGEYGKSSTLSLNINGDYRVNYDLTVSGGMAASRSQREYEFGTLESASSSMNAGGNWKPSYSTNVNSNISITKSSVFLDYTMDSTFVKTFSRVRSFNITNHRDWGNIEDGVHMLTTAMYRMSINKIKVGLGLTSEEYKNGNQNNSLWVSMHRLFGR
jgi:hypothetical protein